MFWLPVVKEVQCIHDTFSAFHQDDCSTSYNCALFIGNGKVFVRDFIEVLTNTPHFSELSGNEGRLLVLGKRAFDNWRQCSDLYSFHPLA